MTRHTTALMIAGPASVGAWGDDLWRVAGSFQLVEGSTPYWITTPTQPVQHPVGDREVLIHEPFPELLLDSVLVQLGAQFGDADVEACLVETHNLELVEGVRVIAPFFELSQDTTRLVASRLSQQIRLGVTYLDAVSLLDDAVVSMLRGLGFTVDVFAPVPVP